MHREPRGHELPGNFLADALVGAGNECSGIVHGVDSADVVAGYARIEQARGPLPLPRIRDALAGALAHPGRADTCTGWLVEPGGLPWPCRRTARACATRGGRAQRLSSRAARRPGEEAARLAGVG